MKFPIAVVQCNGQITDRSEATSAGVRSSDVGRRVAAGFDRMLEEQLLRAIVGPVAEQISIFDDRPGLLQWRWVERFAAAAIFFIAGRLKFTWFFFAGHQPEGDAAVVRATENCIGALAMEAGTADPCVRLAALRERPLALEGKM
jgi:hypothetical protein